MPWPLQLVVERARGPPVRRHPGRVADDVPGDPDPLRLVVLVVHPGVADVRRGLGDDLPVVRRVGQRLLVAGHPGGEHRLAEGLAGRPVRRTGERPAVLQDQQCRLAHVLLGSDQGRDGFGQGGGVGLAAGPEAGVQRAAVVVPGDHHQAGLLRGHLAGDAAVGPDAGQVVRGDEHIRRTLPVEDQAGLTDGQVRGTADAQFVHGDPVHPVAGRRGRDVHALHAPRLVRRPAPPAAARDRPAGTGGSASPGTCRSRPPPGSAACRECRGTAFTWPASRPGRSAYRAGTSRPPCPAASSRRTACSATATPTPAVRRSARPPDRPGPGWPGAPASSGRPWSATWPIAAGR